MVAIGSPKDHTLRVTRQFTFLPFLIDRKLCIYGLQGDVLIHVHVGERLSGTD